jgi:hypothetical protein
MIISIPIIIRNRKKRARTEKSQVPVHNRSERRRFMIERMNPAVADRVNNPLIRTEKDPGNSMGFY